MRIIFSVLLISICLTSFGQAIWIKNAGDTVFTTSNLRVGKAVRFPYYATGSASNYFRVDASGYLYLSSGGSSDSTIFYPNYRADTSRMPTRIMYMQYMLMA